MGWAVSISNSNETDLEQEKKIAKSHWRPWSRREYAEEMMENWRLFQRFFSHDDGYGEETCGRKVVGGTEGSSNRLVGDAVGKPLKKAHRCPGIWTRHLPSAERRAKRLATMLGTLSVGAVCILNM